MHQRWFNAGSAGLLALLALLTACGSTATTSAPGAAATSTTSAAAGSPATTIAQAAPTSTAAPEPTVLATHAHAVAEATITAAPGGSPPAGAETRAEIKLFMFKPATLDVKAGTTIVWTNQDAIEHSVTAGTPGMPSSAFDSDFFVQGQSFSFAFTQPGTYDYFCKRHDSMTGKVRVTAP
jgi:plastocyanin